jgi:hypothetical protein
VAKESNSKLVAVSKNGEILEVNPGTLEAHKRSGWEEVKEDQVVKALPLGPTKLTPEQVSQAADALEQSTAGGSEEEGGDPALQDASNQPRTTGKRGKG